MAWGPAASRSIRRGCRPSLFSLHRRSTFFILSSSVNRPLLPGAPASHTLGTCSVPKARYLTQLTSLHNFRFSPHRLARGRACPSFAPVARLLVSLHSFSFAASASDVALHPFPFALVAPHRGCCRTHRLLALSRCFCRTAAEFHVLWAIPSLLPLCLTTPPGGIGLRLVRPVLQHLTCLCNPRLRKRIHELRLGGGYIYTSRTIVISLGLKPFVQNTPEHDPSEEHVLNFPPPASQYNYPATESSEATTRKGTRHRDTTQKGLPTLHSQDDLGLQVQPSPA